MKSSRKFATAFVPLLTAFLSTQSPALAVPGIAWRAQNFPKLPLNVCGSEAALIAMRMKFSNLTMKSVSSDTWYGEAFNNDTGLFIYCITNRDTSCLGRPGTSVMVWATSDRGSGEAKRWVDAVVDRYGSMYQNSNC